ncbi:MAG: hypothetical protein M3Z66_22545 [Chloroflexota bacterium]|nr:hypothetical protein [Chloroflexota bacterium]
MDTILVALIWIAALIVTLYASEHLVRHVSSLAPLIGLSAAALGLLVALGADAPEVTSALIALTRGATNIGLGVVIGSNIYNLAGLLGIAAIVARRVSTGPSLATFEAGSDLLLTGLLFALIALPALHIVLGAILLIVLAGYVLRVGRGATESSESGEQREQGAITRPVLFILLSVAFIIAGSDVMVNTSITLGSAFGIPSTIVGTFVLAIATSIPNTWGAVSLARRGEPSAAIATAFTSNAINIAIGAGLPSLFITLHASPATRALDLPWLLGMTLLAMVLLATRRNLTRLDGGLLLAAYIGFVILRLLLF